MIVSITLQLRKACVTKTSCTQLRKACLTKTSCTQLLLNEFGLYMLKISSLVINNVALSLYDIINSVISPCLPATPPGTAT